MCVYVIINNYDKQLAFINVVKQSTNKFQVFKKYL